MGLAASWRAVLMVGVARAKVTTAQDRCAAAARMPVCGLTWLVVGDALVACPLGRARSMPA